MESPKLCSRCRRIHLSSRRWWAGRKWRDQLASMEISPTAKAYVHSKSFAALKDSAARTGCVLCRVLTIGLKTWPDEGTTNAAPELADADKPWPVVVAYSHIQFAEWTSLVVKSGERWCPLDEVRVPGELEAFTNKVVDPLDTTTGSPRSLGQVKTWLDTCIRDHSGCVRFCPAQVPTLPTRVIDVGPAESRQDPVLAMADGRRAQYVALSHCWGRSMRSKTTSANLPLQQQGIPLRTLPRSFRDAIAVTKALGCRYLWIDALCIIQDSDEDWDLESARMQLVYRNALVTVSAVGAEDSEGGCFSSRDPLAYRPTALRVTGCRVGRHRATGESFWRTGRDFEEDRLSGPLYERAWAFQEQALSGRTIAYCAGTVSWMCLRGMRSETDPHGARLEPGNGCTAFDIFPRFQNLIIEMENQRSCDMEHSRDAEEPSSINRPASTSSRSSTGSMYSIHKPDAAERRRIQAAYGIWYDMLARYSSRGLTYANDRLPAISALAEHIGRVTGDQYFAGLWRQDMVEGLLWRTFHRSVADGTPAGVSLRVRPPCNFVAPSWSWASVVGHVFWDDSGPSGCSKIDVTILDVTCPAVGSSVFGRVSHGIIRLRGYVKTAVVSVSGLWFESGPEDRALHPDYYPDEEVVPGDSEQLVSCFLIRRRWTSPRAMRRDMQSETSGYGYETKCAFLVLVPTGLGENEYRRVGLGETEGAKWGGTGAPPAAGFQKCEGIELKEILLV